MTTLSRSVSYGLRLLVAIMLTLSNLFLLIAICTNQWAAYARGVYIGIWKICDTQLCLSHSDIIHAKVFLIFFVILNILTNIYVIIALWIEEEDSKKLIGKTSIFNGILGLAGLVSATVYFVILEPTALLYGFGLGWLATILVVGCGTVSLVHSCLEPDKPSTLIPNMMPGNMNPPPPPYPGTQAPPSSIIVS